MRFSPVEKLKQRLALEKKRLETGERQPSRFRGRGQQIAVKALAVFFSLMLLLTILSRAADGITVAKVSAEGIKSGVLTERVNASGSIEALGNVNLTLPAGLDVEKIHGAGGQQVKQGDPLMQLNLAGILEKLQTLENEISLLELKINSADKGNTSESTELIAEARQALQNAKEDYTRTKEDGELSVTRAGEDLLEAENALEEALAELEKAKDKAIKDRIKKAAEELDAAKEALEATKESRQDAIDAAQAAVDSARDASYSQNSEAAERQLERAKAALKEAENDLKAAQDAADEDAIKAAQAAYDNALAAYEDAEAALDSASAGEANHAKNIKKAREELKKVTERWDQKVEKAEADVKEKEDELEKAKNNTDVSEEAVVISAQSALDAAEQGVKSAKRSKEDAQRSANSQLVTAQRSVDSADRGVRQAEEKAVSERRTGEESRRQAEIEKLGYLSEKRSKEKERDALRALSENEGILTSPIDGNVQTILGETGVTQDGQKLAVIARRDKGFSFAAKLPEKEAENLHVGDRGTIEYTVDGKKQSVDAAVTAISPTDEEGNVTITVQLPEGSGASGAASMEITRQSTQYGSTLPLSALRSDQNGEYVLVIREKQSVMGSVKTAVRVPVTVLDKDSDKMAVEASLLPDDFVITGSSKPVSEGDRVRLNEKTT